MFYSLDLIDWLKSYLNQYYCTLQFFYKGWWGRQNSLPSHRCRGPTKGWQCCFLVRSRIWKKCAQWDFQMTLTLLFRFFKWPWPYRSGIISARMEKRTPWPYMGHVQCCTAQNGVGAYYSLNCWTSENPKEFSNLFSSGEQMKINRNSKILFFFHSGKQMDPRRSPDLAEALSTH